MRQATRFRFVAVAVAVAAVAAMTLAAADGRAQSYPSRPVRLVVPYPPGGTADALIRPIAQKMSERLGQPVVLESKPGANGVVGMDLVAKATPDGYTLVLGAIGPLTVIGAMQKLPFDPVNDFAPVAFLAAVPNVLVVNSTTPVKSVSELVALAKSKPGQLNYGSAGPGSSNQLAAELFNQSAGVQIVHVPYKGGAPAQMDLLGGQLTLIFDNLPAAIPHVRSGALRPLALTSLARLPVLPEVPTMSEQGFPGFEAGSWFGLLAPAGTPRPVIDALNAAAVGALRDPVLHTTLQSQGFDLNPGAPDAFAQFIRAETQKWSAVVRKAGITGQ